MNPKQALAAGQAAATIALAGVNPVIPPANQFSSFQNVNNRALSSVHIPGPQQLPTTSGR